MSFLAGSQLSRGGVVAHGRLVIRLVEDDPASPWLVTFDDQEFQDEEIHDDELGPVVTRADDSDNTASKSGDNNKPKTAKKKSLRHKPQLPTRHNSSTDHKAGSGSEESSTPDLKKKKRSPSLDHQNHHSDDRHSNAADTDASSPIDSGKNASSKVSDREQRSRRRHQSDADDAPSTTLLKNDPARSLAPVFHPSKKIKTKGGEEVVKIPMLTGTLYLYRGAKRRVAFIPKI